MIHFNCPQCHAKIEATDNMAGKTAKCKACGATITAPAPSPPNFDSVTPSDIFTRDIFGRKKTMPQKVHIVLSDGIATVLLGILSLAMQLVPTLQGYSVVIACLGILFALSALCSAIIHRYSETPAVVIGFLLNGIVLNMTFHIF